MAKLSFNKLSSDKKKFLEIVSENYPEYISEDGKITTKGMKEVCQSLEDSGYPQYSFNNMKVANWLCNATFNSSGTRGEFWFPMNDYSEETNMREISIDIEGRTININHKPDEEVEKEQEKYFRAMEIVTRNVFERKQKAVIIRGCPGMGKSHLIETLIEEYNMIQDDDYVYFAGGSITPSVFYETIVNNSDKLIIMDDCDSLLVHDEGLKMIKGATQSTGRCIVSWGKRNQPLSADGSELPYSVEFIGQLIFISNLDTKKIMASKKDIAEHLEAVCSRVDTFDIDKVIYDNQSRLVWIKRLIRNGLLENFCSTYEEQDIVVGYLESNYTRIKNPDLRTIFRIAEKLKLNPDDWEDILEALIY